jgi:hypothetical protein
MLTIQDCIALCGLSEAEVDALAEHEHLPEIVAVELGNYLIHRPDGVPAIRAIIRDDIAAAERRGDIAHAHALRQVLRHFVRKHRPAAPAHSAAGNCA